MAVLTKTNYEIKYNSSGSGSFLDNSTQSIIEATMRGFAKDTSDSLMYLGSDLPGDFRTVAQAAHGFIVGNVLKLNGSGVFTKVTTPATDLIVGVVSTVVDVNNFIITYSGYVSGLTGLLAAGSQYYATAAGILSTTPLGPAVLIADTTASGYMLPPVSGGGAGWALTGTSTLTGATLIAASTFSLTFTSGATNGNWVTFTQGANTAGSPTGFTYTGGAHTTLTLSAEAIDVNFALNRTVQFSTGALATQRAFVIQAPTYAFVGASTITTAATLAITGAPALGTNASITTPLAFWVQGGDVKFDGTKLTVKHIESQGTTPSISPNTGAGGSPTISVTGTDLAGFVSLTSGTAPASGAIVFILTFNLQYSAAPRAVIVTGANALTQSITASWMVLQADIAAGSFTLKTQSGFSLTAATAYAWYYIVIK